MKIKVAVIDVYSDKGFYWTKIEQNDLDAMYQIINCTTIDICVRKVGGMEFDFIVDDEGLLKDHPVCSACAPDMEPMLFGNLIIAHHDAEGNTTGLTPEEIEYIAHHTGMYIHRIRDPNGGDNDSFFKAPLLMGVEY